MNRKDKPIIDMTKPFRGTVRKADRDGAVSRDPRNCVGARCALRSIPGAIGAKIGAVVALIEYDDRIERGRLSAPTLEMVKAYDKSDFYPIGVPIVILPPSGRARLGARKGEKASPKTGNGRPNIHSSKTPWLRHIDQPES